MENPRSNPSVLCSSASMSRLLMQLSEKSGEGRQVTQLINESLVPILYCSRSPCLLSSQIIPQSFTQILFARDN
jgi:hypothetical protein